ncbi:hypothetical protein AA313_de0202759 [Arthrobotrys entomopaga]|nr:hypothetical protein AA313_de0202759 [Arthrobotrys entomopaga]
MCQRWVRDYPQCGHRFEERPYGRCNDEDCQGFDRGVNVEGIDCPYCQEGKTEVDGNFRDFPLPGRYTLRSGFLLPPEPEKEGFMIQMKEFEIPPGQAYEVINIQFARRAYEYNPPPSTRRQNPRDDYRDTPESHRDQGRERYREQNRERNRDHNRERGPSPDYRKAVERYGDRDRNQGSTRARDTRDVSPQGNKRRQADNSQHLRPRDDRNRESERSGSRHHEANTNSNRRDRERGGDRDRRVDNDDRRGSISSRLREISLNEQQGR